MWDHLDRYPPRLRKKKQEWEKKKMSPSLHCAKPRTHSQRTKQAMEAIEVEISPRHHRSCPRLYTIAAFAVLGGGLFGLDIGVVGSVIDMHDFKARF